MQPTTAAPQPGCLAGTPRPAWPCRRHTIGGTGPGGGGAAAALSRSVSAHYGDPYAGLVGPAGGGQPPPRRCLSTDPAALRAELAAGLVGAHHSSIDMEAAAAGGGPPPRGAPAFGVSRWSSLRLDSRRWRSEVGDDEDYLEDLGELSGGEEGGGGGGADVGDGEDLPEDSAFSYTSRSTMAEEAVTYQEVAGVVGWVGGQEGRWWVMMACGYMFTLHLLAC